MKQYASLFPIPVGFYELDPSLTQKEKDYIINLQRRPNVGNESSVDNYILENKKLLKLKKFFSESANTFLHDVYSPKGDVKLKITQCWANYSEKGHWHHLHQHPNSFISGVFYVQSNSEKDRIYFIKDQYKQFDLPTDNFNNWNSATWWFPSTQGTLIIFPSSLSHKVEPVEVDTTRISISFNTFLVGNLGDAYSLTECKL